MQRVQLAGKAQLLHLCRVSGMDPSTFGWVTAASLGQLLTQGLRPRHYFQCSIQLCPYEAAGAYYDTILEANLVWGDQLNSFTICKAHWQDSAQNMRFSFQLIFHTPSPPPPAASLVSPAPVAIITRNKLINKRLLFQTRADLHYYFNFIHREVSCSELMGCYNSRNIPRDQEC